MARGERVIAISQFVAEHAATVYGVGPDRLRTIPRGVDLDIFDPTRVGAERIVSLARQWRLPDGAAVVMLPGRLTRWKGGLDLITAVAALGRRDICCLLVGSAQRRGFRRELEAAIDRHGLGGLFRIVDDCRDMAAAYMLADVVVSASSDPEGFGRVIIDRARDHRMARAGARSQRSCGCDRRGAVAGADGAFAARPAGDRACHGPIHPREDVRPHDRSL